jgi:molybdopterin biosynthesis enzyme MoaB
VSSDHFDEFVIGCGGTGVAREEETADPGAKGVEKDFPVGVV